MELAAVLIRRMNGLSRAAGCGHGRSLVVIAPGWIVARQIVGWIVDRTAKLSPGGRRFFSLVEVDSLGACHLLHHASMFVERRKGLGGNLPNAAGSPKACWLPRNMQSISHGPRSCLPDIADPSPWRKAKRISAFLVFHRRQVLGNLHLHFLSRLLQFLTESFMVCYLMRRQLLNLSIGGPHWAV